MSTPALEPKIEETPQSLPTYNTGMVEITNPYII